MFPRRSAVIQTTNRPRVELNPSPREAIRKQNSRPAVRLPHLNGRCSTKPRAGTLSRRFPYGPSGKCFRNIPRLVMFLFYYFTPQTPFLCSDRVSLSVRCYDNLRCVWCVASTAKPCLCARPCSFCPTECAFERLPK